MKLRTGVILELFRILWFLKIILHPALKMICERKCTMLYHMVIQLG